MRIILVTNSQASTSPESPNALLEKAFHQLASQQPGHEWLVTSPLQSTTGWAFLNTRKTLASLRKSRPDLVLFPCVSNAFFPNDIPIAILIADKPAFEAGKGLARKLSAARAIITSSKILADEVAAGSGVPQDRIHVLPLAGETKTISPEQRSQVREQFTGGKEYFLYTGPIGPQTNWERLFQAFSSFKKWQQSGLQLVLTGDMIGANFKNDFDQQLDLYKYKHDVVVAAEMTPEQKDQLAAAAFVLVSPFKEFEDAQHIINAFRNGVPVITDNKNELAEELAGDAAIYTDIFDAALLSKQMINLYKNEPLYNDYIQKGKSIALQFNWQEMLDTLSRLLLSAAED